MIERGEVGQLTGLHLKLVNEGYGGVIYTSLGGRRGGFLREYHQPTL